MTILIPIADESSEAEDTFEIDTLKRDLLEPFNVAPYVYRAPRPPQDLTHLPRNVLTRRKYAVLQRQWRKNRGAAVKRMLDGKNPLASTTYPLGTAQYWRELFTRESPPMPHDIGFGDNDLLEPVTPQEIAWLKKTVDRDSAPGPDGLRPAQFLTIPDHRLQHAYTRLLELGRSSGEWQAARTALLEKTEPLRFLAYLDDVRANQGSPQDLGTPDVSGSRNRRRPEGVQS